MRKYKNVHADSTAASDGTGECTEMSDSDSTDDNDGMTGYRFFFSNHQGKGEKGNRPQGRRGK